MHTVLHAFLGSQSRCCLSQIVSQSPNHGDRKEEGKGRWEEEGAGEERGTEEGEEG